MLNFVSKVKMSIAAMSLSIWDIMKVSGSLAAYTAMGEPDVLLGAIPLYNCTFFDVSLSQDILKFRAVEAQFLAHQPATAYAMRIDFRIPSKYSILIQLIQAMYYFSAPVAAAFLPTVTKLPLMTGFPEQYTLGNPLPQEDVIGLLDPKAVIRRRTQEKYWTEGKVRLTFPVILKNIIFFDMYIESFFWSRDVEDGDIIRGTVLLRKYIPPPKRMLYIGEVRQQVVTTETEEVFEKIDNSAGEKFVMFWDDETKVGPVMQSITSRIEGEINMLGGNTTFNLPAMVDAEYPVGTIGESDYYEDMMKYTKKDALKQFIYYLLSKARDVIVEKGKLYKGLSFESGDFYDIRESKNYGYTRFSKLEKRDYNRDLLIDGGTVNITEYIYLNMKGGRIQLFFYGTYYDVHNKHITFRVDNARYFITIVDKGEDKEVYYWWVSV